MKSTQRLLLTALLCMCLCTTSGSNSSKVQDTKTFSAGSDDFLITIATNGSYRITINGSVWLNNAPTYFNANNHTYTSSDGSLKLLDTSSVSGIDSVGTWQGITFLYKTNDQWSVQFTAVIKVYDTVQAIVFQQVYTDGAEWTQGESYNGICGGFPGFQMEGPPGRLGYLSYGGYMIGDTEKKIGLWSEDTSNINDGIVGGPLALFDRQGRSLVISPFNNFMSASFLHDKPKGGNYYGGIMGGVSMIQKGHHQDFIIYYGQGINKAFEGWGKTLRNMYGKSPDAQKGDITINYLGYWTDNGAYYYYNTEKGKNYQQTVFDVVKYSVDNNIPYRYFQYDSWWYYKGIGDGVKTWISRPDVFPDGFVNVSKKINLPAAAHNRYWAPDTTYAKQNGGKYDFIVEKEKAVPISKQFWVDLFTEAKDWGLVLYEQDWLNKEFVGMQALLTDLNLGAKWLTQMAEAAHEIGINIQYCMSNPRHALQSLLYPAVTQIRVSDDYQPGKGQWSIGISSILGAALGIAPFKDTFWTTETQNGNIYNLTEPNWKLNAIVSTLSTGPVGPSDMVGATNIDILMKCCRRDGLILKPQFPIRAVDGQIIQAAFKDTAGPDGEVWVSYTDIAGLRWANLLVLNLAKGTTYWMYPENTGLYGKVFDESILFATPYDAAEETVGFNSVNGLKFTDEFNPERVALYQISPGIPGWGMTAIVGELDKWVPVSRQRIQDLSYNSDTVVAKLIGAPNEAFVFWYILNKKGMSIKCMLDKNGEATFTMYKEKSIATCE